MPDTQSDVGIPTLDPGNLRRFDPEPLDASGLTALDPGNLRPYIPSQGLPSFEQFTPPGGIGPEVGRRVEFPVPSRDVFPGVPEPPSAYPPVPDSALLSAPDRGPLPTATPVPDYSVFGMQPPVPVSPLGRPEPFGIHERIREPWRRPIDTVFQMTPEQRQQWPRTAGALDALMRHNMVGPAARVLELAAHVPGNVLESTAGAIAGYLEERGLHDNPAHVQAEVTQFLNQALLAATPGMGQPYIPPGWPRALPAGAPARVPWASPSADIEAFVARARGQSPIRQQIDEFLRQREARERGEQQFPRIEGPGGPEPPSPPPPPVAPQAPPGSVTVRAPATGQVSTGPREPIAEPPAAPRAPEAVDDVTALRTYGYTDEQIGAMTPAQIAMEATEARDALGLPRAAAAEATPADTLFGPEPAPPAAQEPAAPPQAPLLDPGDLTPAPGQPTPAPRGPVSGEVLPPAEPPPETPSPQVTPIEAPPPAPQEPSLPPPTEVAPRPAQPPAPVSRPRGRGPLSLMEFIAANGGIRADDPLVSDVRSIIGSKNKFIPGFGPLIRKNGRGLDRVRESVVEGGYLHDPGDISGGLARTTIPDVLNLLDAENRGQKVYSRHDEGVLTERHDAAREKEFRAELKALKETAKTEGLNATPAQLESAARSAVISRRDAIDELVNLMERDAVAERDQTYGHNEPAGARDTGEATTREGEAGRPRAAGEAAPFGFESPSDQRFGSETQAEPPGLVERVPGPAEHATEALIVKNTDGKRLNVVLRDTDAQQTVAVRVVGTMDQARAAAREMLYGPERAPTTEPTAAGQQGVLPGAERIGQGQLAQRRADQPLKPKVAQRPADEGLFGDESKQGRLFEGRRTGKHYEYLDLGPFQHDPTKPLGGQAQSHVLNRGRLNGDEHIVAFDANGKVLANGRGVANNVGLSPELRMAMSDPKQSVVVHHNHPNDRSISEPDIAALAAPGLHAVWAHGNDGSISRAELTPAARAITNRNPAAGVRALEAAALRAGNTLVRPLQAAVKRKAVTADDANQLYSHLIATTMHDAGIIDYASNIDASALIANAGIKPYLRVAAENAAKGFLDAKAIQDTRPDRPAVAFRHVGDLGASLERGAQPAGGRPSETGPPARRPPPNQPAQVGQLRLPGIESPAGGPFGGGGGRGAGPPGPPPSSRAMRVRQSIANRFGPGWSRFVERTQNLSLPVHELQKELEARHMGTFPDAQDFHAKKRLFPGRRATEVDDFNKDHLDPIVSHMRKEGISLPEGALYLYAKHAAERNAAMDAINPAMGGAGSGMTDAQAAAVIHRFETGPKAAAYRELARQVTGVRNFILDTMESGGLERPEVIEAWRKQYTDYVPLRGWEDAPTDAPRGYRPAVGFNVRGKEVQPALGRRSRADNPLVNIIDQAYRAIDRAERNRYLQAFDQAMTRVGRADVSDIATRDRGEPKRRISPTTGFVETVDTAPHVGQPNVVSLKIGGNPVHWVFKDTELAEAIKRMSPDQLGMFQPLLTLQNKLKAIWTHYSPDFLARHFLARYPIEGTLNSFEQKEGGPHSVMTYAGNAVPFMGKASRAIFAANKGARPAGLADYVDYWNEMRAHGGAMTFRSMRDLDLLREHLQTQLMSLSGRPIATVRQRWRKAIEAMDAVTNALDNSLRLAAYVSARKQGKTPQQAALIAREATVDFQQKGKWANAIGLWFPFGNVAIQTSARMTKAVARSKIMRRVFMGTMLTGFMASAFNYLIGGNDSDGVPYFDKIPEWDKRLNFIILNPFDRDEHGRPMPIKIPMPYNWALPLAMGYAFGNAVFGSLGVGKSVSLVTHAALESLTPFGSEHNKVAYAAPELLRPFVHVALNQKFSGSPVHIPTEQATSRFGKNRQRGPNAETPWRRPTPEQEVGTGWRAIAQGMNYATGGNRERSGLIDYYPEDYRELLGYAIGTPLRFMGEVSGTASSLLKGERPPSTNIPLLRVFRGADYDAADRAAAFERSRAKRQPWLSGH